MSLPDTFNNPKSHMSRCSARSVLPLFFGMTLPHALEAYTVFGISHVAA